MMRMLLLAALLLSLHGPASADTVLKIGVLNDRSGPFADLTGEGSVVAARLAVEDFGGKGLSVEIVAADHQNRPDVGASIARAWYDQGGVDVIVDVPTSSVALAINQLTYEKNKVFLASGPGTADLTGPRCTPNTIHWTFDTVALANGTARALVERGSKTWFFITADYAFGHAMERDASEVVRKSGGSVLGSVRTPFPSNDFSSFLLAAKESRANVVGLANAGSDTINSIKQANEFGLPQGGQVLAGLLITLSDVRALGLRAASGLIFTEAFYWNLNAGTRAWSARYASRMDGKMPGMGQAGVYSAVVHYLKTVSGMPETDRRDGRKVVEAMKALPTDDPLLGRGSVRPDGRKLHAMYLFETKKPEQSNSEWDLYNLLATIPAEQAFRPMTDGGCPLVRPR